MTLLSFLRLPLLPSPLYFFLLQLNETKTLPHILLSLWHFFIFFLKSLLRLCSCSPKISSWIFHHFEPMSPFVSLFIHYYLLLCYLFNFIQNRRDLAVGSSSLPEFRERDHLITFLSWLSLKVFLNPARSLASSIDASFWLIGMWDGSPKSFNLLILDFMSRPFRRGREIKSSRDVESAVRRVFGGRNSRFGLSLLFNRGQHWFKTSVHFPIACERIAREVSQNKFLS